MGFHASTGRSQVKANSNFQSLWTLIALLLAGRPQVCAFASSRFQVRFVVLLEAFASDSQTTMLVDALVC